MPFIGQEPLTGAYHVLDDITTSATATYNLQLNSAAFSPATANQLLVSLNGVIQKPGSSFTISGSQITFSSALTSSDSIDFIIALGDVLSVGTPTDGSVNTGKIANSAVTTAKIVDANVTTAKLVGETVIQVKSAVDTTARTTTSQTFVVGSNTAQVSITPRSTSSRFIIHCTGVMNTDDGNDGTFTTIFRDSTNLGQSVTGLAFGNSVPGVSTNYHPFSMTILDSPSTTSAITYGLRFRSYNFDSDASTTSRLGYHLGGTTNAVPTHITVMELAG
tara:strand:+ start:1314 stop:2141 length:828 start_codon:yes stop_codon:yes gene_type:complete